MKGKMLIVLVGIALAFGLVFASCDNALYPKDVIKKDAATLSGKYDGSFETTAGDIITFSELYSKGVILRTADGSYATAPKTGADNLIPKIIDTTLNLRTLTIVLNDPGDSTSGTKCFKVP